MSWGYISIAMMAVSVVGKVIESDQQRKAYNYQADVAEQNAIAAQNKAKYEEDAHRRQLQKIMSTQRTLYGKANIDLAGSPLLVMEDTAAQGELDALAIRFGGDIAAAQQRSAANLARMQGQNAMTAGYISAGTSLLAGAKDVSGLLPTPTAEKSYVRH
jgi:hypothetical protein